VNDFIILSKIQTVCFYLDTNIGMLFSNWEATISNQDPWINGRHLCMLDAYSCFDSVTVQYTDWRKCSLTRGSLVLRKLAYATGKINLF